MKLILKAAMIAVALTAIVPIARADCSDASTLEEGKTLFQSDATPACAICHALKDAGASGAVGPDLDELKPDLEQIKKALLEGVGVMPSFADSLTDEQRNAVADYVFRATHPEP